MPKPELRIGGVLRCCLVQEVPLDACEGTVVRCPHCGGGLKLVTREDGQHWEARWITENH